MQETGLERPKVAIVGAAGSVGSCATQLLARNNTVQDLAKLYAQSPKFEQIGRILTEELFKNTSERLKSLLSESATERYINLLNTYPEYVQNIPLKYLASYLNIKPESLSRVRKKL
jgi:hypothetical protein